jgi:hypothetical protein
VDESGAVGADGRDGEMLFHVRRECSDSR